MCDLIHLKINACPPLPIGVTPDVRCVRIRYCSAEGTKLFKSNLLCRWNVCTASVWLARKRDVIAVAATSLQVSTAHLPHPRPFTVAWVSYPALSLVSTTKLYIIREVDSKRGATGPDCTIFPNISIHQLGMHYADLLRTTTSASTTAAIYIPHAKHVH